MSWSAGLVAECVIKNGALSPVFYGVNRERVAQQYGLLISGGS